MSQHITMKDLHDRFDKLGKREVVLDVRGFDEFRSGHVPRSMNIPHTEVGAHTDLLKTYDRVYVHCQAGRRAQMAFETLEKSGLKNLVCVSGGGMGDWIAAGYEVER